MSDQTGIEWTDATWNPVAGCSIVSPGCINCYAMKMAARLDAISVAHETRHGGDPGPMLRYRGLTQPSKAGPVWTGTIALVETALMQPLRWKRPRRIFVNSMSDLFHEGVPDDFIDKVFAVMALTPQHTYQVLTKRAERMRDYLTRPADDGKKDARNRITWDAVADVMTAWYEPSFTESVTGKHRSRAIKAGTTWPLANVWLGVSVENQKFADERIPLLLDTPAAIRWISAEPLLGPIDLVNLHPRDDITVDAMRGQMVTRDGDYSSDEPRLDWVVVGGESGPGARPMHPDWARSLRDQCGYAGVPFFFKQWGKWLAEDQLPENYVASENPYCIHGANFDRLGKKAAGHLLDGVEHREFPKVPR